MKRYYAMTGIFLLMITTQVSAQEIPYIYKGVRPMGMGGAFVALSDDANALFYNPSGLADIKTTRASVFSLEIETDSQARDMYLDAVDTDFDDDEDTASFLRKYIGDYGHASISIFPNYVRPNFAFGIIGSAKTGLQARDLQYPKLIVDVIEDAGVCAGYAHAFLDDTLLVGAGAKYLFRRSISEEYSVADITTEGFEDRLEDDFEEGSGALLDLGVIYKVREFKSGERTGTVQVGISANNLVGNGLGDAVDLDTHVDVGAAVKIGPANIAFDYVDISSNLIDDQDTGRHIHLGVEYAATEALRLRTGLYQGYMTLGIGFETKSIQLDVLTYAEEISAYSGQQEDRRYLLRMGFGF